jgi:hypothetical protein
MSMANRVDCANRWPCVEPEKRGAFGTGMGYDTSPRNGCCIATLVAIRELLENPTAYREPIPSELFASTSGSHTGTC